MTIYDLSDSQVADIRLFADLQSDPVERNKLHALLDAYVQNHHLSDVIEMAVEGLENASAGADEVKKHAAKVAEAITAALTAVTGLHSHGKRITPPIAWPIAMDAFFKVIQKLTAASEALTTLLDEVGETESEIETTISNLEDLQGAK